MDTKSRSAGVIIAIAILAAACSDSATQPDADPTGTYALISVAGSAVPTVIQTGDGDVEVLSGEISFGVGTCSASMTVREPGGQATETLDNTCTWTRTGAQIAVHWSNGDEDTATLQGQRVTLLAAGIGGLVLVFER